MSKVHDHPVAPTGTIHAWDLDVLTEQAAAFVERRGFDADGIRETSPVRLAAAAGRAALEHREAAAALSEVHTAAVAVLGGGKRPTNYIHHIKLQFTELDHDRLLAAAGPAITRFIRRAAMREVERIEANGQTGP